MTTREECIRLLAYVNDEKLNDILKIIKKEAYWSDEKDDFTDEYYQKWHDEAISDPDNQEFISFEDFTRELGIDINEL